MFYLLPAIPAAIDYHAVAVLETQLICEVTDDFPEVRNQFTVIVFEFGNRADRFTWDDQYMGGRLWRYVMKSKTLFVLVNNVSRNFTGYNFLEDILFRHCTRPV
jgi:hypothetical protein